MLDIENERVIIHLVTIQPMHENLLLGFLCIRNQIISLNYRGNPPLRFIGEFLN
jgi:hypothetical protein